ncbi:uncharacterized protein [Mytilus edulis]|uniref:uncharacterized protein n=1 Tax=Mytilus edulis TaxID=6550 RepID=UPI0039F0CE92
MMAQEAKVDIEFTIPSVCQICDTSSNIKWMCLECDLFFCLQCESKFHTKSKTLAAHSKIDIEKCGNKNIAEVIRKGELQNIQCDIHADKKCSLFCRECGQTICTNCVMTNSHKDHKLNSIEEVYDGKVQEMKDFQKRIRFEIPLYQKTEDNLKDVLAKAFKQYSYIKEHVIWKEKEILNETKNYAKKLLDEAETEWKTVEQQINQEITVVKNITENFKKEREVKSHTLQVSKLLAKTFPIVDNTYSPDVEVHQIKAQQHYFRFQSFEIKQVFGYLSKGPGLKLVETYQTNFDGFTKILPLDYGQAVISSWNNRVVQEVHFDKNDMIVRRNYPKTQVYDMAVTQNGKILVSKQESELKLLRAIETIETFHSFTPFKTFGIHVNKENEILVGLASSSHDGDGRIVVLDSEGTVKRTFENDKEKGKSKLFSCPLRIVTNFDSSICFIEKTNNRFNTRGRLVVINNEGTLKWTSSESGTKFEPVDLSAILSSGLILVTTGSYNTKIHVFNQKGDTVCQISLEQVSNTRHLFRLSSACIAVDSKGMLFVGGGRKEAQMATFKIIWQL